MFRSSLNLTQAWVNQLCASTQYLKCLETLSTSRRKESWNSKIRTWCHQLQNLLALLHRVMYLHCFHLDSWRTSRRQSCTRSFHGSRSSNNSASIRAHCHFSYSTYALKGKEWKLASKQINKTNKTKSQTLRTARARGKSTYCIHQSINQSSQSTPPP